VLGDVYPLDTAFRSPDFTQRLVRWMVRPGSIIILHDRDERGRRTAAPLRRLLPELALQGYQVLSVGELVQGSRAKARRRQAPIDDGGLCESVRVRRSQSW
jgi:peptidoglycan/xylan/chitin deacetylase (PgdA/CDA1 family)